MAMRPSTAIVITLSNQYFSKQPVSRKTLAVARPNMLIRVRLGTCMGTISCQHHAGYYAVPHHRWEMDGRFLEPLDYIVVACHPQIRWSGCAILDLQTFADICRENNTLLIVDATQSIGIMPFDVNAIQLTLDACSVHKLLR